MIKNFIYLDEEKMYSLSSQVFEGITEYVLNEKSTESENIESQKGPVGSGRILGDILRQADKKTEKKFLSDFSYTLFEQKLLGSTPSMKEAIMNMVANLTNVEETFIGRLSNEVIIDPIALYTEL